MLLGQSHHSRNTLNLDFYAGLRKYGIPYLWPSIPLRTRKVWNTLPFDGPVRIDLKKPPKPFAGLDFHHEHLVLQSGFQNRLRGRLNAQGFARKS